MKRACFLVSLLLFTAVFTTGCLGKREIDDLAMVMAVGIDKGKEPDTVLVTTQIARPGDARGQSGSPSGGTGEPIWTAQGEGKSIFEAIRNIGRYSSRRVFWAHNQVIVINEEVARDGITDIIDFFSRNHELRMRTWVVVTPEKASRIVATRTGLEVIPGVSVNKLFRYSQIVAEAPRTDMRTLAAAYYSQSTHPVLAKLQITERTLPANPGKEFGGKSQIELSGAAVFDKDKMVGWLSPVQTRGFLWFTENVESGVLALPCPDNRNQPISLEMRKNKFSVTPLYKDNQVSFTIKLEAYLDLVEIGCKSNRSFRDLKVQLEKEVQQKLASEIRSVITQAQNTYKVDFLELGRVFQNKYPSEWRDLHTKWDEMFPDIPIRVEVHANIHSPVLMERPSNPGKD